MTTGKSPDSDTDDPPTDHHTDDSTPDESASGRIAPFWKRRRFLQSASAVALGVGTAGCAGDDMLETEDGGGGTDTTAVTGRNTTSATGTPTGTTGTATTTTGSGPSVQKSETQVVEINTEDVEQAPDPTGDPTGPPEGYVVPEEEFEKLKEQAANGELPQPPASEIQRDAAESTRFYDGAAVDSERASISIGNEYKGWHYRSDTRYWPSDANIAVGPEKAVQAINIRWAIYDKSSGNQEYEVMLADWFEPLIDKDDAFVFDPKTLYDHTQDRYVLMAIAKNSSTNESYWLVAVSDDDNPFGTWWIARIDQGDTSNWVDYPGLGLDANGIYLTCNMFPWPKGAFQYSRLVIIDKAALYNGGSFTYWWYKGLKNPDGSDAFTVQPSHAMTLSNSHYLVNSNGLSGGDTLTLWELENPVSQPRLSSHEIDVSTYSLPPNAKQPDTDEKIDTGDSRLMNAVFENGYLWTAHQISYDWGDDGDAEALIKWYKIDVEEKTLAQSRGWGRQNGYYVFPTVASNAETSMMMVYNEIGPETSPRIEVAGRTRGHAKSSLESVAVVKQGESGYTSGPNRWGDYNGMVVDPGTGNYWSFSQYAKDSDNTTEYEGWVAEATF